MNIERRPMKNEQWTTNNEQWAISKKQWQRKWAMSNEQ